MKYIYIALFLLSCNEYNKTSQDQLDSTVSTKSNKNHSLADEITQISLKDDFDFELAAEITQSLTEDLKDKSIVFLGEADHYHYEKFLYRLRFIEKLAEMGYTNIYAEIGYADGIMVNRFLETGDEDYLKHVGLYGFVYGESLKYSNVNFIKEVVRYLKKLREIKLKFPSLKYHGFDLDMRPGTAFVFLDEYLQKNRFKRRSTNTLLRVQTEISKAKKAIELEDKLKYIEKAYIIAKRDLNIDQEFLFHLVQFKNSLMYQIKSLVKGRSVETIYEDLQWREDRMVEIMLHHEKKNYFKEKSIYLGHNGHLSKSNAANANGERYTYWDIIGAWITDRYKDQVFAIWELIATGEHSGHGCPNFYKTCDVKLIPESLEDLIFNNIEKEYPLYFKNTKVMHAFDNELKTTVQGDYTSKGKYSEYLDAYYFIPVVRDVNFKR